MTAPKEVRLAELVKSEERIDRELTGEPVIVQGGTLVPVAAARESVAVRQNNRSAATCLRGRVRTPYADAQVTMSGQEQTVAITDPTGEALAASDRRGGIAGVPGADRSAALAYSDNNQEVWTMNEKYEAPSIPIENAQDAERSSVLSRARGRHDDHTGGCGIVCLRRGRLRQAAGSEAAAGEAAAESETGEGGGSGGGGGGRAKPVGYIRLDADGAHFESIQDESRIALAGIAMVAWAIFWITATIRAFVKK